MSNLYIVKLFAFSPSPSLCEKVQSLIYGLQRSSLLFLFLCTQSPPFVAMVGLFVPERYHAEPITLTDLRIVSLTWGFTLGFGFLTGVKAAKQTITVWQRANRVTTYTALLWIELVSSSGFGFLAWFFLNGYIEIRYGT